MLTKKIDLSWAIPFSAITLAIRPILLANYFNLDLLGKYILILSISIPLAFLIGGAAEVKILSDKITNNSRNNKILKHRNALYIFLSLVCIIFATISNLLFFWIFAATFLHLGVVTSLSLLRFYDESFFLIANFQRAVGVVLASIGAIYLSNIMLIFVLDFLILVFIYLAKYRILKSSFSKFSLKNLHAFNNFSIPYLINSILSNSDRYIVSIFGLEALGIFAIASIFSSAGTLFSGVINSFLFHKKVKNIKYILLICAGLGLFIIFSSTTNFVDWIINYILPLESPWMPIAGMIIFSFSFINIIEYLVLIKNSPQLLIKQISFGLLVFSASLLLSINYLNFNLSEAIWLSIIASSISKLIYLFMLATIYKKQLL